MCKLFRNVDKEHSKYCLTALRVERLLYLMNIARLMAVHAGVAVEWRSEMNPCNEPNANRLKLLSFAGKNFDCKSYFLFND